MTVPVGILTIRLAIECGNKVHASFHQSSGKEQTLAKPVPAVAFSHALRFLLDIEQVTDFR